MGKITSRIQENDRSNARCEWKSHGKQGNKRSHFALDIPVFDRPRSLVGEYTGAMRVFAAFFFSVFSIGFLAVPVCMGALLLGVPMESSQGTEGLLAFAMMSLFLGIGAFLKCFSSSGRLTSFVSAFSIVINILFLYYLIMMIEPGMAKGLLLLGYLAFAFWLLIGSLSLSSAVFLYRWLRR